MNIKQQELLRCICEFFNKGEDDYYTFSDSDNLLAFMIENDKPLKKAFPFKNWCNLVRAKKRCLQTVKLMLKSTGNEFHIGVCATVVQTGDRKFKSTYPSYRFKVKNV